MKTRVALLILCSLGARLACADTIRADLGTAGLSDVGYRFYLQNTAVAARQTANIVDEGAGWYSVSGITLQGDNVRWDSTGTPSATAREDLVLRTVIEANADTAGTTTLLSLLTSERAANLDYLDASIASIPTIMLDSVITDYDITGTVGAWLNVAAASPDPWSVALPGSYASGSAGAIVGKLDALDPYHVVVSSPVATLANAITVRAGDSWTIPISGLGSLSDVSKLWFSVNTLGAPDSTAKLFVELAAGLTIVNGASHSPTSDGALAITDAGAGNITVTVQSSVTALVSGSVRWTVKERSTSGVDTTLATGIFNIVKPGISTTQ
jgi:hypothetical protein